MRGSRYPPAPTKKTSVENTLVFCFIRYLKFHPQGWIRTAAEPTAACGGNREARLGQRSAFSKSCQEAAEKAASATRKARRTAQCNSDDRCQRQKQGGAVGAAASGMHVPPKARCSRWEPRPGFLFTLRGSRHPPAPTKKMLKNNPRADQNPCLRTKARTRQQLLPGAGFLCVKDSEKGKGGKGEFRFYAAFAGAKTSAFFRRACIERTMQLRVKLMIK